MQFKNIEKILKKFDEHKIEALIVNNPSDLFYLTGENISDYWLVITEKEKVAFSNKMLFTQIKNNLDIEVIKYESFSKFLEKIESFFKNRKVKSVGIDSSSLSFDLFQKIKEHSKLKLRTLPEFIKKIREIKDEKEIELIRESCKIAVKVLSMVKKYILPGVTETYIANKIYSLFYKMNVKPSFDIIVASGPNSAYPHHVTSERVIKKNDIVLVDIGCKFNGYCSDLTRTFFLDKINKLYKKVFDSVKNAQESAIREVCPNIKASIIDTVARKIIKKSGFDKYFTHRTGHGIGIDVHEFPVISKEVNTILKKGMVFTVEPGVYIPDFGGVRIEDTVVVTDTGYEILTS